MQSNISVAFSCVQVQSLPYLPSKLACDFRNTQIQEKKNASFSIPSMLFDLHTNNTNKANVFLTGLKF